MLKTPTKPRSKIVKRTADQKSIDAIFAVPTVEDSIAVLLGQKKNTTSESTKKIMAGDVPVTSERRPLPNHHRFSAHIVDLGTLSAQKETEAQNSTAGVAEKNSTPSPSRLATILDERIHLRDLVGYRSISPRPHGFGHFPPKEAVSLLHAVAITGERMFVEHPISEFAFGTILHTMFRVVMWPFRAFGTMPNYAIPVQQPRTVLGILAAMPGSRVVPVAKTSPVLGEPSLYFEMPLGWQRRVIAFALLAGITILPFQSKGVFGALNSRYASIRNESLNGVALLKNAEAQFASANIDGAQAALSEASLSFARAENSLGVVGKIAAATAGLVADEAKSASVLLSAATTMTEGGNSLTGALAGFKEQKPLQEKLNGLDTALTAVLPGMIAASQDIAALDPASIPSAQRETFSAIQQSLPPAVSSLNELHGMIPLLGHLLGASVDRRYLVVFQNDAELRPTGGFIGSYAVIDVGEGNVKRIDAPGGGSYDLQGSLSLDIVSPAPLRLINPKWEFQDANWSPDFPTSAQRLMHFHEKAGGSTTEGVIAINASVMEKLLALTGPIEMPEYNKTISAENFRTELQMAVELEYDKEENKPKKIIADLAPQVLSKLLAMANTEPMKLAGTLASSLTSKEVQVYLRDAEFQQQIASLGWSGEIRQTDGDYLAVVHTNIAGQKTDTMISTAIAHDVQILADGSGIVTLTIKRTHRGIKGTLFSGVRNVDYLRVYTPLGSKLISASGFTPPSPTLFELASPQSVLDEEVAATELSRRTDPDSGTTTSTELGKTVFGNWMMVDPGQSATAMLTYALPANIIKQIALDSSAFDMVTGKRPGQALSYSLLTQSQSGAQNSTLTTTIHLPQKSYSEWKSQELSEVASETDTASTLNYHRTLDHDSFVGTIIMNR